MADQEQAVVHSLENRNLRRRIQFFQMLRPRFGHKGRKPLTAGIELQAVEAVPFAEPWAMETSVSSTSELHSAAS